MNAVISHKNSKSEAVKKSHSLGAIGDLGLSIILPLRRKRNKTSSSSKPTWDTNGKLKAVSDDCASLDSLDTSDPPTPSLSRTLSVGIQAKLVFSSDASALSLYSR